jgi:hypothetical protein
MALWQLIVSTCAGIITIITVFDKVGITNGLKKVDREFNEIKKLSVHITDIIKSQHEFAELQKDQNNALLALLRNDLYRSFKDHRDLGVWTDDEANVQTKLHSAYRALHGNGEEELWWDKKKTWKIVSNEEYKDLISKCASNNI